MQVKATAKYVRMSPDKVRSVVNMARGRKALEVLDELDHLSRAAATPVYKAIKSAVSNAKFNYDLADKDLMVAEIRADEGPSYKRVKARAKGGRDLIKRRTTHISVVLESPEETQAVLSRKAEKEARLRAEGKKELEKAQKEEKTAIKPAKEAVLETKEREEIEKPEEKAVKKEAVKAEEAKAPKADKPKEVSKKEAEEVVKEEKIEKPTLGQKGPRKPEAQKPWFAKFDKFKSRFFRRKSG